MLRHIWLLTHSEDNLWVQWSKAEVLIGRNLWTSPSNGNLAWTWRNILILRHTALNDLTFEVGDGTNFSLWFDPWMQNQSVHARYGNRAIYDSRLSKNAKLMEVIQEGAWR
ncbi:hypothetical protein CFOL_v3_33526 [Cephalotus follicularis]|uniref:Zf-RVT domain-containing protein n=1 Tax=Cephalotus follicularis TaxID=3775 RepID=A0A1Q3DCA7_CEPFO|nr:hypothetical protein CFOL_v3_33526 [Cephalotus follicularis]